MSHDTTPGRPRRRSFFLAVATALVLPLAVAGTAQARPSAQFGETSAKPGVSGAAGEGVRRHRHPG